jgi:hypothetical protein
MKKPSHAPTFTTAFQPIDKSIIYFASPIFNGKFLPRKNEVIFLIFLILAGKC